MPGEINLTGPRARVYLMMFHNLSLECCWFGGGPLRCYTLWCTSMTFCSAEFQNAEGYDFNLGWVLLDGGGHRRSQVRHERVLASLVWCMYAPRKTLRPSWSAFLVENEHAANCDYFNSQRNTDWLFFLAKRIWYIIKIHSSQALAAARTSCWRSYTGAGLSSLRKCSMLLGFNYPINPYLS